MICTGHEKQRLPAAVIGTILNIGLNALLIPMLADKGAATASILSEIAVNVFLFIRITKVVKIRFDFKSLIDALISSLIMGIIVLLIQKVIVEKILSLIIAVFLGVLTYLIMNLVMKNSFIGIVLNRVRKREKK